MKNLQSFFGAPQNVDKIRWKYHGGDVTFVVKRERIARALRYSAYESLKPNSTGHLSHVKSLKSRCTLGLKVMITPEINGSKGFRIMIPMRCKPGKGLRQMHMHDPQCL